MKSPVSLISLAAPMVGQFIAKSLQWDDNASSASGTVDWFNLQRN
jgi:hypothetical protein